MSAVFPVDMVSGLSQQAVALVREASAAAPMAALPAGRVGEGAGAGATDFGRMVTDGLASVNDRLTGSQLGLQQLAVGDASQLHRVMIDLEESRIAFQLMMQVRSRLLEAYQDVMKMPV